jgi:hypothetical protein
MISRKSAIRAAAVLVSAATLPLALPVSSALAAASPRATMVEYAGIGHPVPTSDPTAVEYATASRPGPFEG